jgi:GntR family transcriptional regulator/MocR family aminotransferase
MDQLVAEGYAEGRHGQGLFVVPDLPDKLLKAQGLEAGHVFEPLQRAARAVVPFQPAALDDRLFPHEEWAKLLERCWREQGRDRLQSTCSGRPRTACAKPLRGTSMSGAD